MGSQFRRGRGRDRGGCARVSSGLIGDFRKLLRRERKGREIGRARRHLEGVPNARSNFIDARLETRNSAVNELGSVTFWAARPVFVRCNRINGWIMRRRRISASVLVRQLTNVWQREQRSVVETF